MITQIDNQGNVTIFCRGHERMCDSVVPDSKIEELKSLRKANRKPERAKLLARLIKYGSTVPEELL